MSPSKKWSRFSSRPGAAPLLALLVGLLVGGVVLPALIYACGITILGRYEGGGLAQVYHVVLGGLAKGSVAAWIVFLGPYALYQLARLLRVWWRASARLT